MDVTQILLLVKARLGISTAVRDTYLTAICNSVVDELTKEQGIVLEESNASHLMFCVDLATYRYQAVTNNSSPAGQPLSLPRHLQYRLHNLIVSAGGSDV